MTVYVDDSNIQATVPNGRVSHTSRWSHLFADTEEELHAFAARLGLKRSYFQGGEKHGWRWHYDVTQGMRWKAIRMGAREVTWRQSVELMLRRAGRPPVSAEHRAEIDRLFPLEAEEPVQGEIWSEG